MARTYHPYTACEEFEAGMWRNVTGSARDHFVIATADLMRDFDGFRDAMLRAVTEWPISCIHNLSAANVNRQAWLGHAGCCIATGSPEDCTRLGWHTLTQAEQDEANRAADHAIAAWETGQTVNVNQLSLLDA
jgi:hypothetical protein